MEIPVVKIHEDKMFSFNVKPETISEGKTSAEGILIYFITL